VFGDGVHPASAGAVNPDEVLIAYDRGYSRIYPNEFAHALRTVL
jgi:hypothetical protein